MSLQAAVSGLLGGFNRVSAQGRKDQADRDERQADRENQLLLHIATTSDDQDVSDAAASALVDSVSGGKRPKGGYLSRLVGSDQTNINPAVSSIMSVLRGQAPATPGGAGGGGTAPVSTRPADAGGGGRATSAVSVPPPPSPTGSLAQAPSPATIGETGVNPAALQPPPTVQGPGGGTTLPPMSAVQAPPQVNTPPDASQAAQATASPVGALTPPPPAMDRLTTAIQTQRHMFLTPAERQRQANQLHASGIAMDDESLIRGQMAVWDSQHKDATPEERQLAHDQIMEHHYGTAPKWTNVPGTLQGTDLPPDARDEHGVLYGPEDHVQGKYFIRQNASGGRTQFLRTGAPASATPSATNPLVVLASEMFPNVPFRSLNPTQLNALNAEHQKRTAAQAGLSATATGTAMTGVMRGRVSAATLMLPDGTFQAGLKPIVGPPTDMNGQVIPGAVIVPPSAPLPKQISVQGKQTLTGLGVMEELNQRIAKAIEDAGETQDDNPIGPAWDNWLYRHGMTPENAGFLQTVGVGQAYGLKGLVGGRPNGTLLDIYEMHLAKPTDSPKLIYEKVKGFEPSLETIKSSVLKAEGTQVHQQLNTGKDVQMKDKDGNLYDVHPADVEKAKGKGWTVVGAGG